MFEVTIWIPDNHAGGVISGMTIIETLDSSGMTDYLSPRPALFSLSLKTLSIIDIKPSNRLLNKGLQHREPLAAIVVLDPQGGKHCP